MKSIKISAKTYDEAMNKAIIELQTTTDKIKVKVIEEGSSGFLGLFGSKPWIIEAVVKEDDFYKEDNDFIDELEKEEVEEVTETVSENLADKEANENIAKVFAKEFLIKVFDAMGMKIDAEISYDEKDRTLSILLNSEEDMGILIGKRGQTLDSLQYLVSLVVNKNTDNYIKVKLDTENYRERRKEKLENLAKNIANKVKRSGRAVVLEPMNPYERRIIHSTLQADSAVTTKSEGEEPFRHIVVLPKSGFKRQRKNHKSFDSKKEN